LAWLTTINMNLNIKTDHHNIVESGIKHHKPETTLDTTVNWHEASTDVEFIKFS
jgi:hypothetical protein